MIFPSIGAGEGDSILRMKERERLFEEEKKRRRQAAWGLLSKITGPLGLLMSLGGGLGGGGKGGDK